MAAAEGALKKPVPAYWMWLGDNRERIATLIGSGKGSEVAKKAGEMWKALSDTERRPYEDKAKAAKDVYDKFAASEEGKQALGEKKAARADVKAEKAKKEEERAEKHAAKEEKKNERLCKAAVKAVDKDDALKKPQSAYWLWLGDNRERIGTMLGTTKPAEVAKKAGELWKALSDSDKEPYEKKAKEQKEAHDKYIASDEGKAKLKAFKEATQAAKDQFKPKEATEVEQEGKEEPVDEEASTKKASPKKRANTADTGAAPAAKRGRGAKAPVPEEPAIPADLLKEAEGLGLASQLRNMMARTDVAGSGKPPKQILEALRLSGGLVNKAKAALLGA